MRVKILASALPLMIAGAVIGVELTPSAQPCISIGGSTLQIATTPWQNQFHVSFTDNRAKATTRVQIVDRPELADLVVIDDMETKNAESCSASDTVTFVSVAPHASPAEPIIHLSTDGGADYRIYVQSRSFSVQDAAALIVGAAHSGATQRTAAL